MIPKHDELILCGFLPRDKVELYRRKPEERSELTFLLNKFALDESVVQRAEQWGLGVATI